MCIDQFSLNASARGINLCVVRDETVPLVGCVDALGFERVIGNLINNAIKFTPRGGTVSVITEPSDIGVAIKVEDTGCGMKPNEAQELFRPFSRLGKHQTTPGSGLGLFIVKSIVDAHGGTIHVSSTVGKGTSFTVTFPHHPPMNAGGELICLGV